MYSCLSVLDKKYIIKINYHCYRNIYFLCLSPESGSEFEFTLFDHNNIRLKFGQQHLSDKMVRNLANMQI